MIEMLGYYIGAALVPGLIALAVPVLFYMPRITSNVVLGVASGLLVYAAVLHAAWDTVTWSAFEITAIAAIIAGFGLIGGVLGQERFLASRRTTHL